MKKKLFSFLYFLIAAFSYGQAFYSGHVGISNISGYGAYTPNVCAIYEGEEGLYLYRVLSAYRVDGYSFFYESLSSHVKEYDSYGFPYYDIPDNQMCIINGGKRFIYIDNYYKPQDYSFDFSDLYYTSGVHYPCENEVTCIWSKEMVSQMLYKCKPNFSKVNNGVSLSCNSNLQDSSCSYSIKNIESNFITDFENQNYLWDSTLIPWAEAEEGSGIGVSIDIEFNPNEYSDEESYNRKKCNAFVIMNGYVDFFRRDLFKKNNRVKTLLVESTDGLTPFSFTVDLEDTPEFQQINLPRYAKSIRITIKDVYKGTHYDDTCLSGIFTTGRNYCSENATREEVEFGLDPYNYYHTYPKITEWSSWSKYIFGTELEPHH